MTCSARQYSDQMACAACRLAWDVNDPEPPACKISCKPQDLRSKPQFPQRKRQFRMARISENEELREILLRVKSQKASKTLPPSTSGRGIVLELQSKDRADDLKLTVDIEQAELRFRALVVSTTNEYFSAVNEGDMNRAARCMQRGLLPYVMSEKTGEFIRVRTVGLRRHQASTRHTAPCHFVMLHTTAGRLMVHPLTLIAWR